MKKILFILILAAVSLASCKKDNDNPQEETLPPANIITGVYTISDLAADTSANSSGTAKPFYYSLEDQRVIPASKVQTADWDLAFKGIYNSSIYANSGKSQYSPGFGGPGKGGLYMVINTETESGYYAGAGKPLKTVPARSLFDDAFTQVKTVPVTDDEFKTDEAVGLDHFSGSDDGWAFYDFYGTQFPGQNADSVSHVCYNLPRTLVVKTAKGNYAKVIIYSIYKGAPVVPTRSYKPGFITFKYAIQKDGSKNLDIK